MGTDPSRRRALALVAGSGAAGALGAVAVVSARLASAPAGSAASERPWVPVARFPDLVDGHPVRVTVIADQHDGYTTARAQPLGLVWLVRAGDQVRAFSAACPHLGCTVDLAPGGAQFFCPCHSSSFELDGKKSAGKPNKSLRGLDALPARVTADRAVEVQFVRFLAGGPTAEELG